MIEWVPTPAELSEQVAVPALRVWLPPVQVIVLAPSLNVTVPVGGIVPDAWVTVAVYVTV